MHQKRKARKALRYDKSRGDGANGAGKGPKTGERNPGDRNPGQFIKLRGAGKRGKVSAKDKRFWGGIGRSTGKRLHREID